MCSFACVTAGVVADVCMFIQMLGLCADSTPSGRETKTAVLSMHTYTCCQGRVSQVWYAWLFVCRCVRTANGVRFKACASACGVILVSLFEETSGCSGSTC